ncbi:MAG: hypothetical protein JNL08_00780 [Planctomycetes bacterium]|nr:hypothetical protein [Planctomycetota bacterium]
MIQPRLLWSRSSAALLLALACPAQGHPELIAREGLPLPGSTLVATHLSPPFHDAAGVIGFAGTATNGATASGFAFVHPSVVWAGSVSSPVPHIAAARATNGFFQTVAGAPPVWAVRGELAGAPTVVLQTSGGTLLRTGDPVPGFSFGVVEGIDPSPRVTTDGSLYFVVDTSIAGGTTILYRVTGSSAAAFHPVLVGGSTVDGIALKRNFHNGFYPFQVADNGAHFISMVAYRDYASDRRAIYKDGVVVARYGTPIVGVVGLAGQFLATYSNTAVDDQGNWLASAETNLGVEVLLRNGTPVVREGQVLDGVYLAPQGGPRSVRLAASGEAAFVWYSTVGARNADHLFYAPDVTSVGAAQRVFTAPGPVDFTGDGIADATVLSLGPAGYPPEVAIERGWIHCRVRLRLADGSTPVALVRFPLP